MSNGYKTAKFQDEAHRSPCCAAVPCTVVLGKKWGPVALAKGFKLPSSSSRARWPAESGLVESVQGQFQPRFVE